MATAAQLIETKLTEALKARDAEVASVLRMAKSAIVNERIAKMHDLSDDEELAVLRKEVKKREEAAGIYKEGGNAEGADKEAKEAEYLKQFLPAEMTDEDLRTLIRKTLEQNSISGKENFGRAMGAAMKVIGALASGDRVSQIVKEELEAAG